MRSVDIGVAKPQFHHVDVVPRLNQMHRRGVPECVWANALVPQRGTLQGCRVRITTDDVPHTEPSDGLTIGIQEQPLVRRVFGLSSRLKTGAKHGIVNKKARVLLRPLSRSNTDVP